MVDYDAARSPITPLAQRVSWSSVIAGLVVAIAALVAMSELCAAIGLSAIRPVEGATPEASTLVMGGAVGWLLSSIIALFVGGWTAGHVARQSRSEESTLHGVLVWGLMTAVIVLAGATALGGVVGGVLSLTKATVAATGQAAGGLAHGAGEALGATAKGAGQAAGAAPGKPEFNWDSIKDQASDLFAKAGQQQQNPQQQDQQQSQQQQTDSTAGAQTTALSGTAAGSTSASVGNGSDPLATLGRFFGKPDATLKSTDRHTVTDLLVTRAHLSPQDADRQVDQWQAASAEAKQHYEQATAEAERKAREAAEAAAKTASLAAFFALAATLLGLSAAALGGHVGGHTAGTHRLDDLRAVPRTA